MELENAAVILEVTALFFAFHPLESVGSSGCKTTFRVRTGKIGKM